MNTAGSNASDRAGCGLWQALDELVYPAWLIDANGVVVHFNAATWDGEHVAARMGERLWRQLNESSGNCLISVGATGRMHDVAVDAVAHPLGDEQNPDFGGWHLLVAAPSGESVARDRSLVRLLLSRLLGTGEGEALSRLTPQQRKIYRLLGRRLRYKEIASRMGLSHATIRVQIANIRKILGDKLVPVLRRK